MKHRAFAGIPKRAVRMFLERPRYNCTEWKELSNAEIERKVRRLPVRPPIWTKLRKHQKVCFLLGAIFQRFAFINDTGTGKTLLSIALARYFEALGKTQRIMVLVPNKANKGEWAREIRKHSPETPYCILKGSSKQKWVDVRNDPALIFIETYAGFVRMQCTTVKHKKKNRKVLKPSRKLVAEMCKLIQGFIGDEITHAKNSKKLPYRLCRQLAKNAELVATLTGTPFGRDPTDLWAQFYLVDKGETLGESLGLFRAAFFNRTENYWGGFDYTFDKKKEAMLHRFLSNRSIRYEANAADLPRVIPIYKTVSLPSSAEEYYEAAKRRITAAHGNYQEMKNAFLRMRQISSGFVGFRDDETGDRAQYEFPEKPKLDLMLSTIESIPPKDKILVFTEFNFSGALIQRELKDMGIRSAYIWGKTRDAEVERTKIEEDPHCQVLILGATGRFGLNLQIFKYGMFYESPVSAIIRKQSNRRVERQESLHSKVFLYDFVTRGTVDEQILEFHAEGRDLFRSIVDGGVKPL